MKPRLGRNVVALSAVSFLNDVATEMIYPLLPLFLSTVLKASASAIGTIEGIAESIAALMKLAGGWFSDLTNRRKPLVVAGYTLATIVRPLVGLAQRPWHVMTVRITDRIGKGIRSAPRDALIADSVDPGIRGRAFGFNRAADHAGAVVGPLVAYMLMEWRGVPIRQVFLWAIVPGIMAVVVLTVFVKEQRAKTTAPTAAAVKATPHIELGARLSPRFWTLLFLIFLFTLGNSTDAFLLLRATDVGLSPVLVPVLWSMLHVVKSLSSTPGGALSDRVGRVPLLVSGWLLYAAVYLGFSFASSPTHIWVLFAAYGLHFGLTEGVEKALVADLVPAARRGIAYGWYNLAIGAGALPASLIFGQIWDRYGPSTSFRFGALMALTAALGIAVFGLRTRVADGNAAL